MFSALVGVSKNKKYVRKQQEKLYHQNRFSAAGSAFAITYELFTKQRTIWGQCNQNNYNAHILLKIFCLLFSEKRQKGSLSYKNNAIILLFLIN